MEIEKSISPLYWLGLFLLFLFHLGANLIFFVFNLEYNHFWTFLDTLLVVSFTILLITIFLNQKGTEYTSSSKFGQKFLDNTKTLALVTLTYLGFNLVFVALNWFISAKIIKFIRNELDFIFLLIIAFIFLSYQFSWLAQSKKKNRKTLIISLYFALILYATLLIIEHIFNSPDFVVSNDLTYFLIFTFAVLFFFSFNVKNWLPLSSRNTQKQILWYSLLMVGAFIPFLSIETKEIGIYFSSSFFLNISKFLGFSLLVTYVRSLYNAIISLPFSKVLEQKVYEVNTLTYLSKIVRNFNNLEILYDAIVELASNSMKRSPSFLILYDDHKVNKVKSYSQNEIEKREAEFFIQRKEIQEIIYGIEKPTILPSLSDKLFKNAKASGINYESLCLVPLFYNDKIYAKLVVLNKIPYFFDEDDLSLLVSYIETLSISIEGNNLLKQTIEKEKYKQELIIAREIQSNFLPKVLPKFDNLELDSFFKPSEEVGGDFYDIIKVDNEKILILVGDVSGKGMSAAFYMVLLKGIILSYNSDNFSVQNLFCHLNKTLYNQIDRRIHITISGLLFDLKNKTFEYFRAGHFPLICSCNGTIEFVNPNGLGLALVSDKFFSEQLSGIKKLLQSESYFVLYTDGLVEVLGQKDTRLGLEKLKQILQTTVYNSATELKNNIIEEVNRNGTIFDDDITLLVVKYINNKEK